ncbi:hypothetical protein [Pseudomonas donghuensis]|uniref:hypothetical protein n=1 Tax=Pseudomonas donghuensis TaxID=1163398 RepID=UPI0020C4A53C|nr:hypothetical protein [Pseudomonas donghuensis]MCP6699721.1 hypothetical protein [Pseudomonas donghuensis]
MKLNYHTQQPKGPDIKIAMHKIMLLTLPLVLSFLSNANATEKNASYVAPALSRDESQSFYEPGGDTHQLVYGANQLPLVFSGNDFPADMIVASDVGTNIARYSASGQKTWMLVTYPDTVRAINLNKGVLTAYAGKQKLTIDPADGRVLEKTPTNAIFLFNKIQNGVVLKGLNQSGRGTVTINGNPLPAKTQWARDALIHNDRLYVSDTFGHQVLVFRLKNLELLYKKNFYYPNDLFIANGSVMVVEEHANRVIAVDSGTIQFSCPLGLYMQTRKNIKDAEHQVVKYNSPNGVSRCAREFMGHNTLYSPNGGAYLKKTFVIADTDNHRIVAVKNGSVISELNGINNPVRIILVPSASQHARH